MLDWLLLGIGFAAGLVSGLDGMVVLAAVVGFFLGALAATVAFIFWLQWAFGPLK